MTEPQTAAAQIAAIFTQIHQQQMAGLPLLNDALTVETVGFQIHEKRVLGVLITPWLMSLVLLPGPGDDWGDATLGHKRRQEFPSGSYKFMINEFDGLGRCQTHSLYSPMREFRSQQHARAAALGFLERLMKPSACDEADAADEELLGRVLRGEDIPEINAVERAPSGENGVEAKPVKRLEEISVRVESKMISRRNVLRGVVGQS